MQGVANVVVLMGTFNGERWVIEQVDSILAQVDVNVSLIIKDDSSTDRTVAYLTERTVSDERCTLIKGERQTGSAGANFRDMISTLHLSSNCDYVAFSDQDDLWDNKKLASAIEQMREIGADGYSSSVYAHWCDRKPKLISQSKRTRHCDYLFEVAGQGCTFVVSRSLFESTQLFIRENSDLVDNFFYHDWLIYIIGRVLGIRWVFDNRAFIMYRQHTHNETGVKVGLSAAMKRARLILNGWYGKQIELAVKIAMKLSPKPNDILVVFSGLLLSPERTLFKRLRLFLLVLRHGRRKLSDRLILSIAALTGYI